METVADLLDERTVGAYLRDRGIVSRSEAVVTPLGGGVSNTVLLVTDGDRRLVVKQALPRLRVAAEWLAKRERALTEAAALQVAARFAAGAVPAVLDVDPERCALVVEAAPAAWVPWKERLLDGEADPAVAQALGAALATWHRQTAAMVADLQRFDDQTAFAQLRVDPFHRAVAARHPSVAPAVLQVVATMAQRRDCLVHGDFSPKNFLLGPDGLWVIDFEVAHLGDPAFDLAFLLAHLLLKAVHRPAARPDYAACATAFLDAYGAGVDDGFAGTPSHLVAQIGCLLLARVDGKSPAEYLSEGERGTVRLLALGVLGDPPAAVDGVWGRL